MKRDYNILYIHDIKNNKMTEIQLQPLDASFLDLYKEMQSKGEIKCILILAITCDKKNDINIPE